MSNTTSHTRLLCESAIMLALAVVLSQIVFNQLPYGGETTLVSMLPILLIGLKNVPKWGFGTAFVYSLIQLAMSIVKVCGWGLSPLVFVVCILFDYLLPYTALGVSGFFGGKGRVMAMTGITLGIVLRFLCHFISGITIWATWADGFSAVMNYSLTYNGAYMLPELILTFIVSLILLQIPAIRRLLGLR